MSDSVDRCVAALLALVLAAAGAAAQNTAAPAERAAPETDAARNAPVQKLSKEQASQLARQAAAALAKEDYASAVKALEPLVADAPQNNNAKFNLALAYSMTGRQSDAIRVYQQVLEAQPGLIPARENLGILLLQQGEAAAALEQFQQVVDQQPDHWAAQLNRAAALVALKRNAEAAQAYEAALALKPDHAPTHLAYGELLAQSDAQAAEKQFRRALEFDASLDDARLDLAGVLEDRAAQGADTLGEAAAIYRKYLEVHPRRKDVRRRLGEILLQQNRPVEAIPEFEAARTGNAHNDALIDSALLHAYVRAGKKDEALELIPKLIAQNPADAELRMAEGSLLMEQRRYADAAASFRQALMLAPQEVPGYTNLASALYLAGDYQGTVDALDQIAQMGKDTAGSYFLRAISLDKLGLKGPAFDNYQSFLASDEKKNPDQEFQARQRSIVLGRELKRKPRP